MEDRNKNLESLTSITNKQITSPVRVASSIDGEWKLILLLFLIALGVRLPYLQQIPAFIESNELRNTIDLVNGKEFPLNDFRPYLGALLNYVTAACFWLFGLHYWIPRAIIAAASSAAVPLVYLLGKRLASERAGILAATMMSVSVYSVFFLSHVAWPNSLTPFLTTAMLLCFTIALQERRPPMLIAAAFLFGLALQTHPSVVTLAPSLLLLFLWRERERLGFWLRNPATYFTVPAVTMGYANMIYYNIEERMATVNGGLHAARYAVDSNPNISTYFENLGSAWLLLLRLTAGAVDDKAHAVAYLSEPLFLICMAGLAIGLARCLSKGKFELPLLLLGPMLIIPVINDAYEFYAFGRYLGFLIPLASLLVALALDDGLVHLEERITKTKARSHSPLLGMSVLILFFVGYLSELTACYAELRITGDTTEIYQQARRSLRGFDRNSTGVVVDPHAFKSTPMLVYLEMDGWHVEYMGNVMPGRCNKIGMNRFVQRWTSQNDRLASRFSTTIGILSPGMVDRFGVQEPPMIDGCVVVSPGQKDSRILTCYHAGPALYLDQSQFHQSSSEQDK